MITFLIANNFGQGIAPSINKEWTAQAYIELSNYLDHLPASDYPKLEDDNRLFNKIVNSISQTILENKDFSLDARMGQAISLQSAINQILMKYYNAYVAENKYTTELSYLLGLSLAVSNQVIKVVNEFTTSLDPNNQHYKAQMEGLEMMRNGSATQMDGALTSLGEINIYSDEERIILASYLADNGVGVLNFTAEDYKNEFALKLEKHIAAESHEEIIIILQALLIKLKK